MNKVITLFIFTLISIVFIACKEVKDDIIDDKQVNNFELSGYYYYGYLDERDQLDDQIENEYFYYMDHYWSDYHNSSFAILKDEEEREVDREVEEYTAFFESIGGLTVYSLPRFKKTVHNGDYITIYVDSPILESYPAQITSVSDVLIEQERR